MNYHDERALLSREAIEPTTLQFSGTMWLSNKELNKKLGERIKEDMVCSNNRIFNVFLVRTAHNRFGTLVHDAQCTF
jgi:hypothetical protein